MKVKAVGPDMLGRKVKDRNRLLWQRLEWNYDEKVLGCIFLAVSASTFNALFLGKHSLQISKK
jgi:hypothetical protein